MDGNKNDGWKNGEKKMEVKDVWLKRNREEMRRQRKD